MLNALQLELEVSVFPPVLLTPNLSQLLFGVSTKLPYYWHHAIKESGKSLKRMDLESRYMTIPHGLL